MIEYTWVTQFLLPYISIYIYIYLYIYIYICIVKTDTYGRSQNLDTTTPLSTCRESQTLQQLLAGILRPSKTQQKHLQLEFERSFHLYISIYEKTFANQSLPSTSPSWLCGPHQVVYTTHN